jgi:site-specific recombinase XerD
LCIGIQKQTIWQRAVKAAALKAQIKMAIPHTFRRSFSAYFFKADYDIRTVQDKIILPSP